VLDGGGRLSGRRSDARGRLGRQVELELLRQHLLFGVEFGVTVQDQRTAIGGREEDVEHLDGGEFVEHGPRREAGGQRLELGAQRDVQAVGEEGDEDVRFDAVLKLVIDRAELQIVLEILERGPRTGPASVGANDRPFARIRQTRRPEPIEIQLLIELVGLRYSRFASRRR
jgi:hypothetical protein